jgi:hypothetical protein
MVSSGILGCVALVRTDVSEELGASFIKVTIIGELGTTLAVTRNRRTVHWLLVTTSVVPSSPILVTLKNWDVKFLRNVGFYKGHTAQHPRKRHSSTPSFTSFHPFAFASWEHIHFVIPCFLRSPLARGSSVISVTMNKTDSFTGIVKSNV